MDSKETQLYVYMYPCSPQFTSHPGCHLTLGRVPCRFFLVILFFSINFKYSSGYTSIPNSLTRGIVFQHVKLRGTQTFIPQQTYLNKYSFLVFRYTLSASREGIIITPSFLKELFWIKSEWLAMNQLFEDKWVFLKDLRVPKMFCSSSNITNYLQFCLCHLF